MLIVEDGSVVSGANSYATTQEAIDYFLERGMIVDITDADMIMSTEFLDVTFGGRYKGKMLQSNTQSLLFPRTSFYDTNGRLIEAGVIPKELKITQFQAAKLANEGVQLISGPTSESQLASFTKTVEGAVSKSESYFAPVNRSQTSYIGSYIKTILDTSTSGRTVRA